MAPPTITDGLMSSQRRVIFSDYKTYFPRHAARSLLSRINEHDLYDDVPNLVSDFDEESPPDLIKDDKYFYDWTDQINVDLPPQTVSFIDEPLR